jgi:hypothetical protein
MIALEGVVRPPLLAVAICGDRFRKQLIAIGAEGVGIDSADFDRPEAAAAGVIA